jgi:Alcohol dehydrogenase GroES-like domain
MPKAVVLTQYGPPDVLAWRDVPAPEPGPGQARVRVKAAGVGLTDLKMRRVEVRLACLPDAGLGFEAAGVVDALGRSVSGVQKRDEVARLLPALGGYEELSHAVAGDVRFGRGRFERAGTKVPIRFFHWNDIQEFRAPTARVVVSLAEYASGELGHMLSPRAATAGEHAGHCSRRKNPDREAPVERFKAVVETEVVDEFKLPGDTAMVLPGLSTPSDANGALSRVRALHVTVFVGSLAQTKERREEPGWGLKARLDQVGACWLGIPTGPCSNSSSAHAKDSGEGRLGAH